MKPVASLALLVGAVFVAVLPAQGTKEDSVVESLISEASTYSDSSLTTSKKRAAAAIKGLGGMGARARIALPRLAGWCGSSDKEIAAAAAEAVDRISKASADLKESDAGAARKEMEEAKKLIEELRQAKADTAYRIAIAPFTYRLEERYPGPVYVLSKAAPGKGPDLTTPSEPLYKALSAASRRLADDLVQQLRVRVAHSSSEADQKNAHAVIRGTLTVGPALTVECIDGKTGFVMWRKEMPVPADKVAELDRSKALEEAFLAITDRIKHAERSAALEKGAGTPKRRLDPDVLAILPATLPEGLNDATKKALQPFSVQVTHRLLKEGKLRIVSPRRAAALAAATPAEAGRELGAAVVLAFDVTVSADKKTLTLTAELAEPEAGVLLWRDQWETELDEKDLPAFVTRTAGAAADGARKRLGK